jgi:hypothetical protein
LKKSIRNQQYYTVKVTIFHQLCIFFSNKLISKRKKNTVGTSFKLLSVSTKKFAAVGGIIRPLGGILEVPKTAGFF